MSNFPTIFIDAKNPFDNVFYKKNQEKNVLETDLIKRILNNRKDIDIIINDIEYIPLNKYILYIPLHTLYRHSCSVDSEYFIPFIEHIKQLCQNREKKIFFVYATFVSSEIMNRLKQYILFTTNISFVRLPHRDGAIGFTTFYPLVSSKMPNVEFHKQKILVSTEPKEYIELSDEESTYTIISVREDPDRENFSINIYQFIEEICNYLEKHKEEN